jgi:hypothetical protein
MIFIDDIYSQEYFNIVSKAQIRASSRIEARKLVGYVEEHHIIPDCFYVNSRKKKQSIGWLDGNSNSPNNLVYLTAKEHYRCHWLLVHMTILDDCHADQAKRSMFAALMIMSSMNKTRYELSESDYAYAREKYSESLRGRKLSKEAIRKQLETKKLNGTFCHSEETKRKLSKFKKGSKLSPETIAKRTESRQANSKPQAPRSEEWRRKISESAKGRKLSPETIAKRTESRRANRQNFFSDSQML